ncbi:hypothetical protein TrLO_g9752 [Triparma laevis f. longispina]|uniref:Uncharacterized protein n=1 Tax=Triparma laevis f. longispina TaxID=1714387 RepID=A0A9W7EA96_9STRA|nr:hypothetical protein TrLO_g9752 [Triparma laevis f. longispina]
MLSIGSLGLALLSRLASLGVRSLRADPIRQGRTSNLILLNTFYSAKTGNEQSMGRFLNHDEDKQKIHIFGQNRRKWKKIERGVVEWVSLKIPEWNESQPEWWDARRKGLIPEWAVLAA